MTQLEASFALLLAALIIAVLAKRFDLPYPIALLVGGLLLALVPGLPAVSVDPQVIFFGLLPPVLFEAAYFTSFRDFWRWKRSILLLAVGLVTFTSGVVAALCHYLIPGMNWATGFVVGAIVSPPDAAAAVSILRGMGLPRRVVQILEGESLVNDAAALTIYRFAVAAVVTGTFSLPRAALTFVWIAGGGTLIGLALGWLWVKIFPKLRDPEVEILASFLLAFLSYFLAEEVHASGVMSTVAAGLVVGWHGPQLFSATTRIRATAVWQTAIFLINVVIFTIIGLELPPAVRSLAGYPMEWVLGWCAMVAVGIIVVRIGWVFLNAYWPHWVSASVRATEEFPNWKGVTVTSWTGLRGVVSLAAAEALPLETATGLPFPYRSLIIVLTFASIVATLLFQGLSLRPLIRLLGIPRDRSSEEEQLAARIFAVENALHRMAQLEDQRAASDAVLARVRGFFEDRLSDLRAQREIETGTEGPNRPEEFQTIAEQRVWFELARAEREAILQLRRDQKLGDEALREIERDIDLLEARMVPRQSH
jgi:CPA1 family monovalent cation:H+ antiporter